MGQHQFGYRLMHKITNTNNDGLLGIEVLYDFITAIDGIQLDHKTTYKDLLFKKLQELKIHNKENNNSRLISSSTITLTIYNIKAEISRNLKIKLTDSYYIDYLLNSIVSYSPILISNPIEYFLQVWEVFDDSPAANAGLKPYVHYILNYDLNDSIYFDYNDFELFIEARYLNACEFYVYNDDTENTECIQLIPNSIWYSNIETKIFDKRNNFIKLIGCSLRYVPLPGIVNKNIRFREK